MIMRARSQIKGIYVKEDLDPCYSLLVSLID